MGLKAKLALGAGMAAGWLVALGGLWLVSPAASLIVGGLALAVGCATAVALAPKSKG